MTALLDGIDYTTNEASYDLAPLRRNGLIDRVPGKNHNDSPATGCGSRSSAPKSPRPAAAPARRRPATRPATNTKSITHHHAHIAERIDNADSAQRSLKTHDKSQRPRDQGFLRRRRDCARQRWPFGQHKTTTCLVA